VRTSKRSIIVERCIGCVVGAYRARWRILDALSGCGVGESGCKLIH